ncbi:hypothetical protein PISMIDRAFT_276863 [Pisolithus microcarpus 441]|uniref:Uncharacterized protein n=1 Tax=Pisolithus microcarpus 441 TaxID=765257 RepID=A0A0C9Z8J9_9AGAM|nr:hypothetical protein PISMIDRAFT_276863 [Pisolithus microcarpus 441]
MTRIMHPQGSKRAHRFFLMEVAHKDTTACIFDTCEQTTDVAGWAGRTTACISMIDSQPRIMTRPPRHRN